RFGSTKKPGNVFPTQLPVPSPITAVTARAMTAAATIAARYTPGGVTLQALGSRLDWLVVMFVLDLSWSELVAAGAAVAAARAAVARRGAAARRRCVGVGDHLGVVLRRHAAPRERATGVGPGS